MLVKALLLVVALGVPLALANPILEIKDLDYNPALVAHISHKWKKPVKDIRKIAEASYKVTEHTQLLSAVDIMSICQIESGYNTLAVSKKGAKGLTQILYKPTKFDIETNLKDSVELLLEYMRILGSQEAALHAYNVGIGNYRKGMRNYAYVRKFKAAKQELLAIENPPKELNV